MWALTPVLCLLSALLQGAVSPSPPRPVDVVFSSVNLRNVIQWRPGNDTPPGTHFSVQYAIYGDKAENGKGRTVNWRAVQHCRFIGRSWCDLTNETWDLEHGYYARVRAEDTKRSSRWTQTPTRFDPKPDTSFGPPMVSVAMEESCAIIHLKGPMRYQPDNHTPEVSMATFYPKQMTYNVSVHNVGRNHTRHFPVRDSQYKYPLMDYETEYCFSAKARFLALPVPCQASPWHCITTQQDPLIGQLHRVVLGIVVPSVCVCLMVVAGYLLYRSVRGTHHKTPHSLDLTAHPSLTFHPENPKLHDFTTINKHLSGSSTSLSSVVEKTPQHHQTNPVLPDLLSYAAQRPSRPQEDEEEEPRPAGWENYFPQGVEPAAMDYGFVGVDDCAIAPEGEEDEEEEEEGGREEGGSDGGGQEEARRDGGREEGREEAGGEDGEDARSEGRERKETMYAPQTKPCLAQAPTHQGTCAPPTRRVRAEDGTPVRAHGGPSGVRALRQRLEGGTSGGIFVRRDPHTGLFRIALPRQAQAERASDDGGIENETAGTAEGGRDARARGRDEDVDEGGDGGREAGTRGEERETLLSPYARQCSEGRPAPRPRGSQWGDRPVDYAMLRLSDEREVEETEKEEEEEGTNRVDWDPETGRLLVPQMEKEKEMEKEKGEGLDGRTGGERGWEEEERGARLESVLVRQASREEEEEEVKRGQEEGEREGGSWESDTLLTRWSLKVDMDQ